MLGRLEERPLTDPSDRTEPASSRRSGTTSILEAAALALGARALSAEQLETARLTNELLRRTANAASTAAAPELARSFHEQLLGACPNAHMLQLLAAQANSPSSGRRAALDPDSLTQAADEHDTLLDLVRAGSTLSVIERAARRHAERGHVCCG